MTGAVIGFAAARTARMLRQNAPPDWIDSLVARTTWPRASSRSDREDFWKQGRGWQAYRAGAGGGPSGDD